MLLYCLAHTYNTFRFIHTQLFLFYGSIKMRAHYKVFVIVLYDVEYNSQEQIHIIFGWLEFMLATTYNFCVEHVIIYILHKI